MYVVFSLLLVLATCDATPTCDKSPWQKQIDADLEPFREKGVTKETFKAAEHLLGNKGGYFLKVLIHNRTLYVKPTSLTKQDPPNLHNIKVEPFGPWQMLLRVLCTYHDVPDVEFIYNPADFPRVPKDLGAPLPIFSWVKTVNHYDILTPYWSFLWQHEALENVPPWEDKADIAFWRGSTTGGIFTKDNWRELPRGKLVHVCSRAKDLCDAHFSKLIQGAESLETEIYTEVGPMPEPSRFEEFCKRKYIIVVDGNSTPASRIVTTLHQCASAILWQQTPYFEFFYSDLRPYEHYIPIGRSMDDLISQILWAKNNEGASREIARNGFNYARKYLNIPEVTCFMYQQLKNFKQVLRYTPDVTEYAGFEVKIQNVHWRNNFHRNYKRDFNDTCSYDLT